MDWLKYYAHRFKSVTESPVTAVLELAERPEVISFAGGLPDPEAFLLERMKDATDAVFEHEAREALQYSPNPGYTKLRDWLAERMLQVEGVGIERDQVMITTGGIQGLDLVCKVLLDRGDHVLVEAPTYLTALHTMRSYEARPIGIPMDEDGMIIDALEERLQHLANENMLPKFIYTIPSFQNPTGLTLSADRRKRLVELAAMREIPIVEDAAYSELRYDGEKLPSLFQLNSEGVLFVHTFSKIFGPGVRLGWLCGSAEVISRCCLAKLGTDQCSSSLAQRIVYACGKRGVIGEQVENSIGHYRRKRDRCLASMAEEMPSGVSWTRPGGGFYSWATLPEAIDSALLLERALKEENVAFVAGAMFYAGDGSNSEQGANQIRLSFSVLNEDRIAEGIRRLGRIIRRSG